VGMPCADQDDALHARCRGPLTPAA
jgi:hypothetical protein